MTLLITGGVFLARYILHSFFAHHSAFLPFLIASQVIAFYYGYQFAIFAEIIGALLASYYFVQPYGTFSLPTGDDLITLSSFFIASTISIGLIEFLRRERYSNRLLLMMSQSRYNALLRLDNHRLHLQRRATRARQDLSHLLEQFGQVILLQLPSGEICLQNRFYEITGADPTTSNVKWLDFIDVADQERIHALLHPLQTGRFSQVSIPMHFIDAGGTRKLVDCVMQTIPLDSGMTARALRLGNREKVRQESSKRSANDKRSGEAAAATADSTAG